ncbi:MAG: type II secretion system minor pseudopilin GspJ [Steroidobacteraceae bacterium]
MRRNSGFTLIELLVAMFITAVMFSIGYGAIKQAVNNRGFVESRQKRLLDVQTAMRMFSQDFTQLAPRPVRRPNAAGWLPAVLADGRNEALVSLTRGGWANPAGVQRAALQRVRYVLEDKTLYRESFRVLDAPLNAKPRRRALMDRVTSVKFRYRDEGGTWRDQWPPASSITPTPQDLRVRPVAVEVTVDLEDWGKLVRLIEVAG